MTSASDMDRDTLIPVPNSGSGWKQSVDEFVLGAAAERVHTHEVVILTNDRMRQYRDSRGERWHTSQRLGLSGAFFDQGITGVAFTPFPGQ